MKATCEIKERYTGKIIFSTKAESFKVAVEIAVKKGAYLRGADFGDADLRGAYLRDADLRDADLGGAYLRDADLRGAYLRGAYLRDAYLRDADLRDADLRGAYLRGADLRDADFGDAYLRDADLRDADLRDADLRGADLGGADLRDAYLEVRVPPIMSHQFASEILWRKSKTENQKNFSARIRMELNLCWKDFYKLAKKMNVLRWADKTLSKWDEYRVQIEKIKGAP